MELNPGEVSFLKRFVAENTPLPKAPVQYVEKPVTEVLGPIVEAEMAKGKMQTVSMDEDYLVISILKNAGVLREVPGGKNRFEKKFEHLGEFFSRTGLGRTQVLAWAKEPERIRAFVAQAEKNNAEDGVTAPPVATEIPMPAPRVRRTTAILVG